MSETSNDSEYQPPCADRVARRALVLAGVACRGMLEADATDPEACAFWGSVRAWLDGFDLASEMEPSEARLIAAALGGLAPQDALNAGWRSEGMAVLAWALHRGELPKHDELAEPRRVADSLGFLLPAEDTVLVSPRLRDLDQLQAYGDVAFTVHWRLRQFGLKAEPMDFAEFAKTPWFGPLSLEGVRLIRSDLAIGSSPIADAPAGEVRRAQSIAMERHQAANWLLGHDPVYSEVDTST